MLKVKLIEGVSQHRLEDELNEFLSTISSEEVRNITYDFPNFTAAIEYEAEATWKNQICADCRYWDCGNSSDALIGTCQMCGLRKRFNNTACEKFNDVRG